MQDGFQVDLVALATRREEFSGAAQRAADLPVEEAVRATPGGLPGTQTSAAAQQVAARLGVAVQAFADVVADLAERIGQNEREYDQVDRDVSARLDQAVGSWAEH